MGSPRKQYSDGAYDSSFQQNEQTLLPDPDAIARIDPDGRLLTEEDAVRMSLLRYNTLGEFQFAHVVDDYTFLEGRRSGTLFQNEFQKYYQTILPAHPQGISLFKEQVMMTTAAAVASPSPSSQTPLPTNQVHSSKHPPIYDVALSTLRRLAEKLTIPCCRRCNKAMDREQAHVMATYRCFLLTQQSDVPKLETNTNESIAAKKVLQQIAFFFKPIIIMTSQGDSGGNSNTNASTSSHTKTLFDHNKTSKANTFTVKQWIAKPEERLVCDAALWRCVAHLSNWGNTLGSEGARFRMIATFHASHYIYLTMVGSIDSNSDGISSTIMPFGMWHLYVWRPFLMAEFKPSTFLGMDQAQVARIFDLSLKHGAQWERILKKLFTELSDKIEVQFLETHSEAIFAWNEHLTNAPGIHDEATLLLFLQKYKGQKHAVNYWLAYFQYNLSGAMNPAVWLKRCAHLKRELIRSMNQILRPTATST